MVQRKFNVLGKIVLATAALCFSVVYFDMLLTGPVSLKNATKIIGHFNFLLKNRPARGDLNYDLYLVEDHKHYKIAASWADCFRYATFSNEVTRGQAIELLVRKHNGIMNNSLLLVVSIKAGNSVYLDPDCVNEGMKN